MWMRAKENYYHKRTGKQILLEGKQYYIVRTNTRKNECTVELEDSSRFPLRLDLFEEC